MFYCVYGQMSEIKNYYYYSTTVMISQTTREVKFTQLIVSLYSIETHRA